MSDADLTTSLCTQVEQAFADRTPLNIRGSGSKAFYGQTSAAKTLDVAGHQGVLNYEPSELVIQARAGTRLADIEQLLSDNHQMLTFEPPRFAPDSTLGGVVASGLSGPRRPFAGAVRDAVLGVGLINGKGEALHFGGQVMKNVAGYDLPRLMAGALGTLGVLTDISLKVIPQPDVEYTLRQACSQLEAVERFAEWMGKALPLSAACWYDGHLFLRLSGSEAGARQAQQMLGNSKMSAQPEFWLSVRDHSHAFLTDAPPLWRLSVPPATPPLALEGDWLIDWGGGQRWLHSRDTAERIRGITAEVGGHATLFRGTGNEDEIFHPLPAPLLALHRRLKQSLDPAGILNPGRMYKDF